MPQITIRYDDDSDKMPAAEIAAIFETAAALLTVSEVAWLRDDDLDEEDVETVAVRPDALGFGQALGRAFGGPYYGRGA
ncbi:hypothetical protein [Actinomadura nitritigenes]|uniref:hypothetical protein n=1 Tax=Actinomadura nitritigenes TaxID=134602 RepID=UPI003D8D0CEC